MKKLLAVVLMAFLARSAAAQEVQIKLGTLAPQGSSWHELLKELAERWSQASAGKVKLRIYAGGTQGSEGDMMRKMAVGQLQAASVTNIGLRDVVSEPAAFSTPGIVSSAAEFSAVFPKVQRHLESALEQKGYVVLHWAQVATIYIFCAKPYRTPAEMSDAKFFVWDGDPASVEAFKQVMTKKYPGVKILDDALIDLDGTYTVTAALTGFGRTVQRPDRNRQRQRVSRRDGQRHGM